MHSISLLYVKIYLRYVPNFHGVHLCLHRNLFPLSRLDFVGKNSNDTEPSLNRSYISLTPLDVTYIVHSQFFRDRSSFSIIVLFNNSFSFVWICSRAIFSSTKNLTYLSHTNSSMKILKMIDTFEDESDDRISLCLLKDVMKSSGFARCVFLITVRLLSDDHA